jgi:ribosome-binding protein aMBF1 (putative translation factor)
VSASDEHDGNTAERTTQRRNASPEIRRRLANNVKKLRKARGYTQIDLAAHSHLCQTYISSIERACLNVTLANLEALAK